MFRPCSCYVSTVHEVFLTVLEECFSRAQGMFRPCSRYVLTELDLCFDRARDFCAVLDASSTVLEMGVESVIF